MTARLVEDDGTDHSRRRAVEIDGGAADSEHVFLETIRTTIAGSEERHCFAFDRADFLAALRREFGLVDALEVIFA
ncbi:hypothetical protein ACYX8G_14595 [Microbacterium saperdae]